MFEQNKKTQEVKMSKISIRLSYKPRFVITLCVFKLDYQSLRVFHLEGDIKHFPMLLSYKPNN